MKTNNKIRLGFSFLILALLTGDVSGPAMFFNGLLYGLSITLFLFGLIERKKGQYEDR